MIFRCNDLEKELFKKYYGKRIYNKYVALDVPVKTGIIPDCEINDFVKIKN